VKEPTALVAALRRGIAADGTHLIEVEIDPTVASLI
jgi:thiamine pyrophosphate-dependent acetolactate synthase large subunit-like protein